MDYFKQVCYTKFVKRQKKELTNYDYFVKADTSQYKGEWIAIVGKKIVAHGSNAEDVYKQAKRKHLTNNISLAKAPDEQMLVLASL